MTVQRARCGAVNRAGNPCALPLGYGTDHLGSGRCKFHGGSTRNGRIGAAREAVRAEAAKLGAEAPLDAGEALELAIRLVGGEVRFLRAKIAELEDADLDRDGLHPLALTLGSAVERLARVGKLGLDAGIAERRAELDELVLGRLADAIRAAIGEADLSAEQEAKLGESLRRNLAGLDDIDWRRPRELGP
jgi:hypothetical protein